MDAADQVAFVLQIIVLLGPLALYFLGLGLLHSQAHPCLVNARTDFMVLGVVFIPIIVAPLFAFVQHGWLGLAGAMAAAAAAFFIVMLPPRSGTWVIYNISREQCRRVMMRAAVGQGWTPRVEPGLIRLVPAGLTVSLSALPWLRNVTVRVDHPGGPSGESAVRDFMGALDRELGKENMLPSPTGASLVVIGTALLGVPLWYVVRHMDAIVDVVRRVLLA